MKTQEKTLVTVRLPKPLAKQIDAAAAQSNRSRSGELIHRLTRTFAKSTPKRGAA